MVRLRDLLQNMQVDAERDVRMMLMYTGVSVQRRVALGVEGEEASDLQVTMALLFMLQVLCDAKARNPTPRPMETGYAYHCGPRNEGELDDADMPDAPPQPAAQTSTEVLEKWASGTLLQVMQEAEQAEPGSWAEVLAVSPGEVCQACVAEAPRLGTAGNLARLSNLAQLFFRCSALTLQYNLLRDAHSPDESRSFLTLGNADFLMGVNNPLEDKRLKAIVDAAESEAGQQCLRDMVLSFTLPQHVVGVRRTPLLSREANRIATEQYTEKLGEAHEAAMRGAEWSWEEDENTVHKMGALLSGLCILFAGRGGSADKIRKSDAFSGRVQLPFLETDPPAPGVTRLGFVPHLNEWLVYSVNKNGMPSVKLKHRGFEGLCMAVLSMTSKS